MSSKICVYGSLRKGAYNYNRFLQHYGEENFTYERTTSIYGYQLYSLGAYPFANRTNNPEHELIVDIIECSDNVFKRITGMEMVLVIRQRKLK